MLAACEAALNTHQAADIAVCAAAVSDWSPAATQEHKIKKRGDQSAPTLFLKENPDILATLSSHPQRPRLVIGFAAESQNLLENAAAKLKKKGCDWILANDISGENTFGSDKNHVYLLKQGLETEEWPEATKTAIARELTTRIIEHFKNHDRSDRHPPLRAAE